ncbi:unnamed protein product [Symbiodinium sp. CCMP2592]|nr:unnamed protein product [Symbiodinium sp. CCMP2592]
MSWTREQDWAKSSWASSSWEKKGWECYDTNAISGKRFFRNIQSTPWSTKAGLAGKDVADLRVSDLTRKGLDDFSLRCLSNGEFQSLVFVRSISEAVFVSNLLRHIRQDRIDLDAVAANMHGPAPPDKHKESARFMQPLLGEIVSTIKANSPPPADSSQQSPESEQLARAKRKLKEAGIALTSEKKQAKTSPLPTTSPSPSAEQILKAELKNPPNSVPSSSSPDVVEKWLKKHQSQFRGQAAAFKKHVADVCSVLKDSATDRQSVADLAVKYGLKKSHASKMYWASHLNLFQFVLVPLECYESYQQAWTVEHELIAQWQECEKWLKDLILRYKKFLHNFRSWEETMWEHDFKLESVHCPCNQFAGKLPAHCFVSGHVATGLENLTKLLPDCKSILSASAASTFFPGRNHWMAKSRALFDQWLKRHKLPATLHPIFQSFCDHQWQQHVAALEQSDRLHWALVQKVKSVLHSDFVLYNEDHHPNHVVCYCPRFFLRGVSNTWNDPAVFCTLDGTPEEWRQRILKRVPGDLSRRYAWAFTEAAPLPQGTVFLKRKKQFAKGRTIISYSNSLCSKLLQLTSIALTLMVKTLFADSPGMQSMPQLWKSLHAYWAKPSQEENVEWNDDLVGFFNAVPRKDIMHSVRLIVQEYCQISGCSILSIDMLSRTGLWIYPSPREFLLLLESVASKWTPWGAAFKRTTGLLLRSIRLRMKQVELDRFRCIRHLELLFRFNSHRESRLGLLIRAVIVVIAVVRDDDGVDIIGMNVNLRDLPRPRFDLFYLPICLQFDHQQGLLVQLLRCVRLFVQPALTTRHPGLDPVLLSRTFCDLPGNGCPVFLLAIRAKGPISNNKEPSVTALSSEAHKNISPKTPPKHPAPKSPVHPAQPVSISVDDEQLFQATHRSSYEQLREQITARAKGRNAVDFYEEGMSPLLAYMFFVVHYHENFLTTEGLHTWPIIPHSHMRRFTDRITFTRQRSLPVSKILKEDVEEVLRFLLTRFGQADRPFLPVIPIGQREVVTLARSILASKIPYKTIFQHDAKAYAMPQEALHVWEFPVAHMPGPEEQTNCYYLWGHGTTAEGLVGILTLGRVIRSSAEAVHVAPHDHVCSFYGKATQSVHYEESKLDFVSKLHHSTKNSAGVVVGGYLGSAHHKSKSSSTVHEGHLCKFHALVHSPSGDKRWAVRDAAGRIDKIWILSSTHSISLPMSTPNNPRPITFETGEGQDWGVSWPGLEYSVRNTRALPDSDVQNEA